MRLFVIRKALQMPKCAAALAGAAGPEIELATLCVAAPANGWAQTRDFRASSMQLDERNFV
jgi:hypothetical protein